MGFGLPAAIGAKVARPDKLVVNIDGDGCFMMNIQELATAKIEKLMQRLSSSITNTSMVVQWRISFTKVFANHLCDKDNIGGPDNVDAIYPDFVKSPRFWRSW